MGYANILVSADLGGAAPDRIGLAADLARRFAATLTGVAAHPLPVPILVNDIEAAVAHLQQNADRIGRLLDEARDVFERCAGPRLCTAWNAAFADPIAHLVACACGADLVVVGRCGSNDADAGPLGVRSGPTVMEAGRPVLVVPPGARHLKGGRVVVAWKDCPEARRAVSAALPCLRVADHVLVATVGDDGRGGTAEAVAEHLARHGARVTTHSLRTRGRAGDELIDFAVRQDADLIVLGAYGHSRLREWILGGVTRDLLDRSPVCCLMSH
jgi:nucleotide-binding universal stress UspA family protein